MADSAEPASDVSLETSIPDDVPSLESILCTEELRRRPSRPPDHELENHALEALAEALADSPRSILQKLTDTILEVTRSDSSGVSLLKPDGKSFYSAAIAGTWRAHVGGETRWSTNLRPKIGMRR